MFANLLRLITGRSASEADYERAFVREVQVTQPIPRNRGVERLLMWGWLLIAFKSALVWWACARFPVPFDALWVIAPTWTMGVICTLAYYRRS